MATVCRQNTNIEKKRGSGVSELRKFSNFHILTLLFPSIFCWYFVWETSSYFVSETYILGLKLHLHTSHIQSMQFSCITYGMALYTNDTGQNTNIEKIYVHASEHREFSDFHILKLLFLQLQTLSVQMTPLSAYRQMSKCTDKTPKKHYGGNCPPAPPPPFFGYANVTKLPNSLKNPFWPNLVCTRAILLYC